MRYPERAAGMGRVPERGWQRGGGGRDVLGQLLLKIPGRGGIGTRRGGCPQEMFSEARVAIGADVAVYPYTYVRSRNAFQSRLRSLPPLHFNFLCVPLR